MTQPDGKAKSGEWIAPLAAAGSALATLACCLPLGIAGAAGAFGLSVVLDSLRPWLLTLAVLLLAGGLLQLYRGRGSCRRRSRLGMTVFVVSAVIVLAVIAFPQQVAEAMAHLP